MSDWDQRARDRKAFRQARDPEETIRAPSRRRKVNKPWVIESRYKEGKESYFLFHDDFEWHTWKKYAKKEDADKNLKRLKETSPLDWYEYRLVNYDKTKTD